MTTLKKFEYRAKLRAVQSASDSVSELPYSGFQQEFFLKNPLTADLCFLTAQVAKF